MPATRSRARRWSAAIAVLALASLFGCTAGEAGPTSTAAYATASPTQLEPDTSSPASSEAPASVQFAAMGDMLAHDTIVDNARSGTSYDFAPYFSDIRSAYSDADVIFCNQESLTAGTGFAVSGYPAFNGPVEFAQGLASAAGCNAINLANNHTGDKGQKAIDGTLDVWKGLDPLLIAGANRSKADQKKVSITEVNGIRVALVSFAQYNNNGSTTSYGVNLYSDDALVKRLLGAARASADVVLVSMHWGTENSSTVNANQKTYAQRMADLGADVVIGTGPHVLQSATWLTGSDGHRTLVWYSLGNMLSSQLEFDQLIGGIAQWTATREPDGTVTVSAPQLTPTFMYYEWSAADRAAGKLTTRTNPHIYLLADAATPLASMWPGKKVAQVTADVAATLGSDVTIR